MAPKPSKLMWGGQWETIHTLLSLRLSRTGKNSSKSRPFEPSHPHYLPTISPWQVSLVECCTYSLKNQNPFSTILLYNFPFLWVLWKKHKSYSGGDVSQLLPQEVKGGMTSANAFSRNLALCRAKMAAQWRRWDVGKSMPEQEEIVGTLKMKRVVFKKNVTILPFHQNSLASPFGTWAMSCWAETWWVKNLEEFVLPSH